MNTEAAGIELRHADVRRALRLEYLTVGWNLVEGAVGVTAAVLAGSVVLLGFGIDSFVESASGSVLIWRLAAERRGLDAERLEALDRRAHELVGVMARDLSRTSGGTARGGRLTCTVAVRTKQAMASRRKPVRTKAARFELRMTEGDRRALKRAAEADGLDASTWARRVLRGAAAARLAMLEEEAREPSEADVRAALAARGVVKGGDATHLDECLRRAREEWGATS